MTRQLTLLQEQVAQCQQLAEERSNAFDDLQVRYDELNEAQAADTSQRRNSNDDLNWSIVREELHRQTDHLRSVEAENAKMTAELLILRQRHSSIEVLKEQKRELEKRMSGVEELKEKVIKLEAELTAARQEREEWYAFQLLACIQDSRTFSRASKVSGPSHTPISVTQSLSSLRLDNARLLEENGSNVALLRVKDAELVNAQRSLQELESEVERVGDEAGSLKDRLGRAEQRAVLAERETGFLQAMVVRIVVFYSLYPTAEYFLI